MTSNCAGTVQMKEKSDSGIRKREETRASSMDKGSFNFTPWKKHKMLCSFGHFAANWRNDTVFLSQ